jgi:HEPN domain-containing protein
MYAEKLKAFENVENLGGKAWEHAKACDLIDGAGIKDCSLHCFHYQQMFELLLKHLLETRTEFGAYPLIHKLDRLLKQAIKETDFDTDVDKYAAELNALTVCAEAYRYNFLLNCETYQRSVNVLNVLLDELTEFVVNEKST